jgi:hypothetical protein
VGARCGRDVGKRFHPATAVILQVRPLRFEFEARDAVWFPPGKAANIFRGAFGDIFRRIAETSEYARMFEPRAVTSESGPSGFKDRPRPFVLRAASLDGRRFEPGERFILEVNVFDPEVPALDYFTRSFEQLREEGLGPGRPRVDLHAAHELPGVIADLAPRRESVSKITVDFLTPTELKSGGATLRGAPFDVLFRRTRDRVSGLASFYQNASDTVDFRCLGERAAFIRTTAAHFEQHEYERRSSRTDQIHGLGGFTGQAEYEGELAEFLPWLEAAWWTGVGRLTVWGNGMIRAAIGGARAHRNQRWN